ncbi:MAG: hypothetical protein SVS15_08420 [Thermodesulfobacteriota bacterium]|nr:hypothetical protein [Thermodesulfobacteriota bacterium]
MRVWNYTVFAVVLAVLFFAGSVSAQQQMYGGGSDAFVQSFDNGGVDWQSGRVTAKGIGAPPANAVNMAQARAMAVRAATVVARRNLLEIIKGVQIDSQTTVRNYMVENDVVVNRVRGFLQNSQILDTAYMSDGSVEVTVGIGLRGGFADVVLPQSMPFKPAPPMAPAPTTPEMPAPPAPDMPAPEAAGTAYTGLLVDARGLSARPAMSPKILDENGMEVYGSASVSREYAIQQGMAGYAKDPEKAGQNPRIAANPFMAKATAVQGKSNTDFVIGTDAANMLRDLSKTQNFMEKCRVMIVLD